MEYVNFGKAGVKVSPLALGLGFRGQGDEGDAQRLVEHAIDSGINFIDCANIYGLMDDRANIGRSEIGSRQSDSGETGRRGDYVKSF